MKAFQYLKNVSTLKLDASKCTGCRQCINVCPHDVFIIQEGRATIGDIDNCMECGACQRNCQFGAIVVDAGVGCAAAIIGNVFSSTSGCDC